MIPSVYQAGMMKRALLAAALAFTALGTTGCIKETLLAGQIEGTRRGSAAVDTLSDFEVANSIAFAGLGQFEGFHYLAPDNEDALFLLTKGWAGSTFAFIEDQMEMAEDRDGASSPEYAYQQARAKAGYDRAVHYGIELLEQKNAGFEAAKRNADTMKAWLANFNDPEKDVPNLFWTGYAWMSRVNVVKEDPAMVSELYVGVAMMERVVQLDDKYNYGAAHIALGAYHASSPMTGPEEGKKEFEKALQISGRKYLMAQFNYAIKYECLKGDKDAYVKLLNEVLDAGDVLPEQRLSNTIAKRKAKRYLGKSRMQNCGM